MDSPILELFVKLNLDASEYESGLSKSIEGANGFASSFKNGLGTIAKLGAGAFGAVEAGVVSFAKSAVETGKSFDASMSQVGATMGDKAHEMVEYNGQMMESIDALNIYAKEMGRTTAFSASQASDALNYMALAGYDAEKSMDMLPTVLNLAAAGSMDLATASDMVTDAQSALGLNTDQTKDMIDQFAKTASSTNTSVSQLGSAILTIGATAKNVKGGTLELTTILGALADNGIKGSAGGTHLRNILTSLQDKAEDGVVSFDKFNVQLYDADGNMRSMIDVIKDMQTNMEGMTQESKDALISGVFNKTDLASVNALLNTSSDRFDELTEAIGNSAGSAEEMANVQLDNLAGDITLFQSALEGAQLAISDKLTPALRGFVQFGTEGLTEITEAFESEGVEGAINKFAELFTEGLNQLLEGAPEFLEMGVKILGAIVQGVSDSLPTIANTALEIANSMFNYLMENLPTLLQSGVQMLSSIAEGIRNNLPEIIATGSQMLADFLSTIISALPDILSAGIDIILALIDGITQSAPQIMDSIGQIVTDAWNAFTSFDWAGTGKAIIDGIVSGINRFGSAIGETLKGMASSAWKSVKGFFGISSPSKLMRDTIGRYIPEGLALGIKDTANEVYNAMGELAEGTEDSYDPMFDDLTMQDVYTENVNNGLLGEISDLKNAIMGMQIVLDTGAMVGGLSDGMDKQLGLNATRKAREL